MMAPEAFRSRMVKPPSSSFARVLAGLTRKIAREHNRNAPSEKGGDARHNFATKVAG
jgi:hypothetical protein